MLLTDFLLSISLAAPFVASAVSAMSAKGSGRAGGVAGFLAAVLSFVVVSFLWVFHGETSVVYGWVPSAGLNFVIRLDALAYLFAVLITGIGAVIMYYSIHYIEQGRSRYFAYLSLFMGSMLGLVLAGDLISLFVFWELTTVSSFLLIGFDKTEAKAQSSAFKALLITGLGGLSLLGSLILMAVAAGSYDIADILMSNEVIRASGFYGPLLMLFAVGVATKSAQFPLHIWLPDAMVAPTPISAYLHSAA
ncbi:MAG: proton-conducting transporter membrane subunit, partial [Candidatus Caldarchaeum sp.]|nr:proton-conducting transporter membrane subunit [Candidatus Caldarchaeum sp.]